MRARVRTMGLLVGTLWLRPYVFAFVVLFVVGGLRDLGARRTALFALCVWPLAWLAEFASTRIGVPFGLYHYTGRTRGEELFIADVPLMDSLSFTFLAYGGFCLARAVLARRPTSRAAVALLAGALMMLLDVVIDPLAVRGDRWFLGRVFYYPQGGFYFGVPVSNFLGWMIVGAAGVGAFVSVARGPTARQPRPAAGVALYYAVLAFNLAVTAWIAEWVLFVAGLAVHAALAVVLWAVSSRAAARSTWGSRRHGRSAVADGHRRDVRSEAEAQR